MFAYFPKNNGNPITLIVPRKGEENYEEEEEYFCPECGAKITLDMTKCPKCGVEFEFE